MQCATVCFLAVGQTGVELFGIDKLAPGLFSGLARGREWRYPTGLNQAYWWVAFDIVPTGRGVREGGQEIRDKL